MVQTVEKEILKGVHGEIKPGLNAILGPLRLGKSLLKGIVTAKEDPLVSLELKGAPRPASFRNTTGYVVQDGNVVGTLR